MNCKREYIYKRLKHSISLIRIKFDSVYKQPYYIYLVIENTPNWNGTSRCLAWNSIWHPLTSEASILKKHKRKTKLAYIISAIKSKKKDFIIACRSWRRSDHIGQFMFKIYPETRDFPKPRIIILKCFFQNSFNQNELKYIYIYCMNKLYKIFAYLLFFPITAMWTHTKLIDPKSSTITKITISLISLPILLLCFLKNCAVATLDVEGLLMDKFYISIHYSHS